jgi:hypothetical protein
MDNSMEQPKAAASDAREEEAVQAADKLRLCVIRSDMDLGDNFVSREKVTENGQMLAKRTSWSGSYYGQHVELKLDGKTYLEDLTPAYENYYKPPLVYLEPGNGNFEKVKEGSPEYNKVVDAAGKIDFDGLPDCRISSTKMNVAAESHKIADLLDMGHGGPRLDEVAQKLSSDLKQLSGDMSDYNLLLKGIAAKMPDEPAANPMVHLDHFNAKTGTWDIVTVNTYTEEGVHKPVLRVVQPCNSLSRIALESKLSVEDLQKMNKEITDPDKIFVGQVIKVRRQE